MRSGCVTLDKAPLASLNCTSRGKARSGKQTGRVAALSPSPRTQYTAIMRGMRSIALIKPWRLQLRHHAGLAPGSVASLGLEIDTR